jgi:hypothetical protein
MTGADAWFIHGPCTQHLGGGRIRVASRVPGERSIQLHLSGARKPVAFASPLPAGLPAICTFDVSRPESILEAIGVFEFILAAEAAQFVLASQIVDQQEVLVAGVFELRAKGQLIAVVDMRGDACVLPSARPANFDAAVWTRVERERMNMPINFARTSLAQLMWRYVSRSSRDLLPVRYRNSPIFFRRPPRVDPVLVDEEHLLVMRELAIQPSKYDELRSRLDMAEAVLARTLAALYYVGSITSSRSRAAPTTFAGELPRGPGGSHYSELRSRDMPLELTDLRQLTAPAPIVMA